jgi:hypothetical protein
MSTILRALKKVETDSTENVQQIGPVHPFKASDVISKRLTSLWYQHLGRRLLWIGSGVAIISLVVLLTTNIFDGGGKQKSPSKISLPQESEPQKPMSHRITPYDSNVNDRSMQAPGPTRPKAFAPKPSHDPDYKPNRYTGKFVPEASTKDTDIPPETQVSPPLETEIISPQNKGKSFPSKTDALPSEDSTETETPVEVFEEDPEELRYAQVDFLENGELELQAISYAKAPDQRMAVINNEIVRQGHSLNGYKVIYIGPEKVVVKRGGAQWQLVFMIR